MVEKLDLRLRKALRNWPSPEPFLILDRKASPEPFLILDSETITFFGVKHQLEEYPRSEMACLWVLAERASKAVTRETIREEGHVQSNIYDLKIVICRLKKKLRELAEEARRSPAACGSPPAAGNDIIRGLRGRNGHPGPYLLKMDPEHVRITGPRPEWMQRILK